ncbi:hypothetical protein [Salinispora tropica]|uniref:hypothetical protein n=1 Tax=Salinispora tropica TaxID=168695 RepID=UPI0005B857B7|nr:hypothetical protein [Salinispora tropica]
MVEPGEPDSCSGVVGDDGELRRGAWQGGIDGVLDAGVVECGEQALALRVGADLVADQADPKAKRSGRKCGDGAVRCDGVARRGDDRTVVGGRVVGDVLDAGVGEVADPDQVEGWAAHGCSHPRSA